MLRCQAEGLYPAAFERIRGPILMLHGAYDPHPGRMIHATLARVMPQIEYREWERCGHYPWLERVCRDEFLAALTEWLLRPRTG
jgi:pimeloyl-ACP methyl ester carboxylesterase